jgi:putative NADH-flavin reductase
VLDYAALEGAVAGQQAVLSALGVRQLRKNSILSEGTGNLIRAMQKLGVKRLIVESSLGVGDSVDHLTGFYKWFWLPVLMKNIFADKEIQESLIRASGLDWVIVRPAILTNGTRTGDYRVGATSSFRRKISRADTAEFMLKQLSDNEYLGQAPGLSY